MEKLFNYFNWPIKITKKHFYILQYIFDPIEPKTTKKVYMNKHQVQLKWHFLFPFVTLTCANLYGNVLMVYLKNTNKNFNLLALRQHPDIFVHRAFPQIMWPQVEFAYGLAVATAAAVFGALFFKPYTADRYETCIIKTHKILKISKRSIISVNLLKT